MDTSVVQFRIQKIEKTQRTGMEENPHNSEMLGAFCLTHFFWQVGVAFQFVRLFFPGPLIPKLWDKIYLFIIKFVMIKKNLP